MSDLCAQGPEF